MAIARNITMGAIGAGRKASEDVGTAPAPPLSPGRTLGPLSTSVMATSPFVTAPAVSVLPPPPPGLPISEAPAPPPGLPIMTAPGPVFPGIRDIPIRPVLPPVFEIPPIVFRPPVEKTTTQIAQGAMNQLRNATPAVVREAVSTVKNKNIAAGELLNFLERRTRVGEVLNELAGDWSDQTKQDFAEAFQMTNNADKLPVMDAMVSISILNDPDLRNELLAENTSDASQGDMLENRRIVWQWPEPGTAFTPPYLIMVAVERQDTTQAQNIINSITGDLVDFQGFKIPTAAANKLR